MSKATGRNIFWFVMGGIYGIGWYYLINIGFNFDLHPLGALVLFAVGFPTFMATVVGLLAGITGIGMLFENEDENEPIRIVKKNAKK